MDPQIKEKVMEIERRQTNSNRMLRKNSVFAEHLERVRFRRLLKATYGDLFLRLVCKLVVRAASILLLS